MRLVTRTPSAALSPFVRKLWYFEGPELAHERERKLPQTEMQLLVNLHEDEVRWWDGAALSNEQRTHGAAVSGLYGGPFAIDTAEQRRVVGAVVRPGAAPALFGVAADELASRHVALEALWGAAGARLRERLLEAPSPVAILETLDECLTDRLAGQLDARSPLARLAPSECISFARRGLESGASVASIADELGWSSKRLRRLFSAAVGVAPKSYARHARLQRLLTSIGAGRTLPWAELAVEHGYYDQAHLILEFRSLTGLTPSAYRPRAEGERNHVILA